MSQTVWNHCLRKVLWWEKGEKLFTSSSPSHSVYCFALVKVCSRWHVLPNTWRLYHPPFQATDGEVRSHTHWVRRARSSAGPISLVLGTKAVMAFTVTLMTEVVSEP